MLKYTVNSRLLPQLRLLPGKEEQQTHDAVDGNDGGQSSSVPEEPEVVRYPLFQNSTRRKAPRSVTKYNPVLSRVRDTVDLTDSNGNRTEPRTSISLTIGEPPKAGSDSELQIQIELDFGWIFGWLERIVWLTMFLGVTWALSYDFEKATHEVCYLEDNIENYPFNILPSLSRSMSSFRVGKFLWTITMSVIFVARLLSNHFLHRLYETWYADNWFNKLYLGLAYLLDTLEIISLVMIPAFSLDCDPFEHSIFFRVFICLTYAAELLQYFTRFLKRKKGIVMFSDDVNSYYRQIGILIILQTVFIAFMMSGYILHDKLCANFYYSIFTLGEYITVVINVRFKRDTVLFVK